MPLHAVQVIGPQRHGDTSFRDVMIHRGPHFGPTPPVLPVRRVVRFDGRVPSESAARLRVTSGPPSCLPRSAIASGLPVWSSVPLVRGALKDRVPTPRFARVSRPTLRGSFSSVHVARSEATTHVVPPDAGAHDPGLVGRLLDCALMHRAQPLRTRRARAERDLSGVRSALLLFAIALLLRILYL